jgi:hypothetical protein
MPTGIDCALDCTSRAGAISAMGVEFVGRYYRLPTSQWTPLRAAERIALSNAGLKVVALWESQSDVLGHFSHACGVNEGTSAYHQAMLAGQPAGTPIYFAIDFDCDASGVAGAVNDYFRGVADGFSAIGAGNPVYLIGVYGSGDACSWLSGHGRVTYTWLAQSTGWGGYNTFTNWNIKQGPVVNQPFDHDTNNANPGYGGF